MVNLVTKAVKNRKNDAAKVIPIQLKCKFRACRQLNMNDVISDRFRTIAVVPEAKLIVSKEGAVVASRT